MASASPESRSWRRKTSGCTAVPRFLTVSEPTPRERSSVRSLLRLNGRTSVTSYDVANGVTGLLLGADEQDGPTAVGDVAREGLRRGEQTLRLEEIDDVDALALAVDEPAHLGVPATRLMAEMDSGLQQLADSD